MGEGVLGNVQGGHAAQCMTVSKMYKTTSATLRLSFRSGQHPTSPGHAVNKRLAPGRQAATATRIQDTGAFVHMFVHQPEGWAAAEWNIPDRPWKWVFDSQHQHGNAILTPQDDSGSKALITEKTIGIEFGIP